LTFSFELRISGCERPIAEVPLFVSVTVIVPVSPGKNETGSRVTFETYTSAASSTLVVLEVLDDVLLVLLVELVEELSAKQTGTIISNRMIEHIPSFIFMISP